MWNDYYLKFVSENDFKDVSEDLNNPELFVFDVLGDLSSENHFVEGYHVNLRSKLDVLPEELSQYEITKPDYPKRTWFGE